jgi:hypothetical protein
MTSTKTTHLEKAFTLYSHKRTEENVKITARATIEKLIKKHTKCATFGCAKKTGKCVKCNKSGNIVNTICKAFTVEAEEIRQTEEARKAAEKASKKRVTNGLFEAGVLFCYKNKVMKRADIVSSLAKKYPEKSEGGWKTMIGAIMLAMNHISNPKDGAYGAMARALESSSVYNVALNLAAQELGKDAKTIGRSAQYVYKVHNILSSME